MFTNNEKFGGNFENPLSDLIANANHLEIITGYIGLSVIRNYFDDLVKISKSGQCRIVIGMAYKEGLEPFKLKLLSDLDEKLRTSGSKNGVFVTTERVHAKIYKVNTLSGGTRLFSGSSNFSHQGLAANIELMTEILDVHQKKEIENFINFLHVIPDLCVPIGVCKIKEVLPTISASIAKSVARSVRPSNKTLGDFEILKSDFPKKKVISKFQLPLRVGDQPNSSLNLYFDKGRQNKKGIWTPRDWFEIEITSLQADIRDIPDYPKGDFMAYYCDADKFYKLPMNTSSAGFKRLSVKGNGKVLGELIKGKLERKGCLERYERITEETIKLYGRENIEFQKIGKDEFYLIF